MPVGGRTDGRTDMTKLVEAFRNFSKKSKNQQEMILTWSKTT